MDELLALVLLLVVTALVCGLELLEWAVLPLEECWPTLFDLDAELDFRGLDEDDVDAEVVVEGAKGSIARLEERAKGGWIISGSFSGEDGESLDSWATGLYGGIGFTFPPFF